MGDQTPDELKSLIESQISERECMAERIKQLQAELEKRDRFIDSLKVSLSLADSTMPPSGLAACDIPDLTGRSIAECAFLILKQSPMPISYQEIYELAKNRGYVSGANSTKVAKLSFLTALKRAPDIFERHGPGKFSLTHEFKNRTSIPPTKRRKRKRSNDRLAKIRDCLEKHGPCSMAEIAEKTGLSRGSLGIYVSKQDFDSPEHGLWSLPEGVKAE